MRAAAAALIAAGVLVVVLVVMSNGRTATRASPPAFVMPCDRLAAVPLPATNRPRRYDVRVGPLVSYGLATFATMSAKDVYSPRPGIEVVKAPIVIVGRRDVTITVPREFRSVLSLDYDPARHTGRPSVSSGRRSIKFPACAGRDGATGYSGALVYGAAWGRCLPLEFRVAGRRAVIRHPISFGAGGC